MPNKVLKKKLTLKKKIRTALTRVLLTILIFLIGMILIKQIPKIRFLLKKIFMKIVWNLHKLKNYIKNILEILYH